MLRIVLVIVLGKNKVYIRAKWPTRLKPIPVSATRNISTHPWMGC